VNFLESLQSVYSSRGLEGAGRRRGSAVCTEWTVWLPCWTLTSSRTPLNGLSSCS